MIEKIVEKQRRNRVERWTDQGSVSGTIARVFLEVSRFRKRRVHKKSRRFRQLLRIVIDFPVVYSTSATVVAALA